MRRSALAVSCLTALTALTALASPLVPGPASGQAADSADSADGHGAVWNILPPGSRGNVTALGLVDVGPGLEATPTTPVNFADQLEMYDALTRQAPGSITRGNLDTLFKREAFTPEQVVSTESPREGATIVRDQFGVPYITGTTFEDVEFGAGYAAAQDRMFLMDALRHTGQARS